MPAYLKEPFRHQAIVLVGFVLAFAVWCFPLQRHISLAWFQHRAISVALVAVAFLLQSVISWRSVSIWGRLALLGSSTILGVSSWYFWVNPWLGNPDLATNLQLFDNRLFGFLMFFMFCALVVVWVRWWIERYAQIELAAKTETEHNPS